MSSESVEVVRRTIEAFNGGGVEAALVHFDPEVEWVAPPEWLEKPLYEGHDGIREIAAVWNTNFEEFRLDLEDAIEAGDQAVALVRMHGRTEDDGVPIEQRIGYCWKARDGKTVRVEVYFSWEEALRAAGLR